MSLSSNFSGKSQQQEQQNRDSMFSQRLILFLILYFINLQLSIKTNLVINTIFKGIVAYHLLSKFDNLPLLCEKIISFDLTGFRNAPPPPKPPSPKIRQNNFFSSTV